MSKWNLAQLPDEVRQQVDMDKAVAAVAYLERMASPCRWKWRCDSSHQACGLCFRNGSHIIEKSAQPCLVEMTRCT